MSRKKHVDLKVSAVINLSKLWLMTLASTDCNDTNDERRGSTDAVYPHLHLSHRPYMHTT